MTNKTTAYHEVLRGSLADPEEARAYLNAVLEEYPEGLPKALRNVSEARQITRRPGPDHGASASPATFEEVASTLHELGLRIVITLDDLESKAA